MSCASLACIKFFSKKLRRTLNPSPDRGTTFLWANLMILGRGSSASSLDLAFRLPKKFSVFCRGQVDSKVLKNFGGVDDAQFLTEIKKERPYFAVLAEKASETVDSILLSRPSDKGDATPKAGVAKPRVSRCKRDSTWHLMLSDVYARYR